MAQDFLKIHEDYGLSNEQVALENLELQTNKNGYLLTPFDVKEVETTELEKLNEYDLTGPLNSGIQNTNETAVLSSEDSAVSNGLIYLIPLGIKGGSNGTMDTGYKYMERYAYATEKARNASMSVECTLGDNVKHSELSKTEWSKHLDDLCKKAYDAIADNNVSGADEINAVKEWAHLADTGTDFSKTGYASAFSGSKFFIKTTNAINLANRKGFGITDSKDNLSGYKQYSVNYKIAAQVQKKLEDAGYTVRMSRDGEDDTVHVKDFSVLPGSDEQTKAVIVIGTNCKNSANFYFTAWYSNYNKSNACGELAKSIVNRVATADATTQIKKNGIGNNTSNKGVHEIKDNYFLNQQRKEFPMIYCECATFHKNFYGATSDTVKRTITEYGGAIANGILDWLK